MKEKLSSERTWEQGRAARLTRKGCLFGLVLFFAAGLCGCGSSGRDGQQTVVSLGVIGGGSDREEALRGSDADAAEEDMLPDALPEAAAEETEPTGTETIGADSTGTVPVRAEPTQAIPVGADPIGTLPEQRGLEFGDVVNLGFGFLVYTVPDTGGEDYRLYFFLSEEEEDRYRPLSEISFDLSKASYTFPDAREGNVPIGKFKEIYYFGSGDMLRDGTQDIVVIAVYEKDGNEYYDTRVYEASGNGFAVNTALTQELNEKYYDAVDYPVQDIMAMPVNHG